MIAVRLLWLAVLLVAIPAWVGNCFLNVDKPCRNPVFLWISGQMLLWAGFQVICVPVILLEGRMWMVTVAYCGYILVLLAAATVRYFRQSRTLRAVREAKPEKAEIILWVLAGVLLLVQLVLAVLMVYGDGDDAYYVAISAAAEESGRMYQKIPYTGMHTELDVRHGLAPFPIWIAWLAQMTGITTVIVAKTLVPVALISMTYGVFYLLGSRVLFAGEGAYRKKWALPAFLLCTEVLVLFGDYSYYTVENFMIARSRQGKAALGSILIPMIFFLLLTLLRKIQEEQKITVGFWVLLGSVMTACCLASTMAGMHAGGNGRALWCGQLQKMETHTAIDRLLYSLHCVCRNVFAVGMIGPEEKNGCFKAVSGIYGDRTDRSVVPGESAVSVAHREKKIYPGDVSLCAVSIAACLF